MSLLKNFEQIVADIYSKSKAVLLPFIIAFPVVYAVFAFKTSLYWYSYFDKIIFVVAIEVLIFSAFTAICWLKNIPIKDGAIIATADIMFGGLAYGSAYWATSISCIWLFFLAIGLGIIGIFIFGVK